MGNKISPNVTRYVILPYLNLPEGAKVSLICKQMNKIIDSNNYNTPNHEIEDHFSLLIQKQFNVSTSEMRELEEIM